MYIVPSISPSSRQPEPALPARMAALASLPVFFKLDGKRVVVAGGTSAASWKVELLAAAGAQVDIYAEHICDELAALIQHSLTIQYHPRQWQNDDLDDALIVIADSPDAQQAQAVYQAGKAAGASVNVIDKPEFCDFQFGAIVNRSPIVVSISTDGAAPILGQAIRRRIETLLPPALAQWGALAKSLRTKISEQLSIPALRRSFWERFADQALARHPQRPLKQVYWLMRCNLVKTQPQAVAASL